MPAIISAVFTYFQLRFFMFSSIYWEKQGYYLSSMSVFTREWASPTDLSCVTDSLQNTHRRELLFIDNRQFVGFLHKQNWAASTEMNLVSFTVPWWNIKCCLQSVRRNSNLQLSLLFCFTFRSWYSVRVARGRLRSPETLLYPNISNYSEFAVLGKSWYSSTYVKLGVT